MFMDWMVATARLEPSYLPEDDSYHQTPMTAASHDFMSDGECIASMTIL